MQKEGANIAENHLLSLLPRSDRLRLLAISTPVQLELGTVLCEAGAVTAHVYFPQHCYISLVTRIGQDPGLEVGMVGREGMLGAHMALGARTSPLHALVQGPGAAWRIGAHPFRRKLDRSKALQKILRLYAHVLMGQLATSAACTRFHKVGPRLARWLLMSQDRAHSSSFHLTQEFVAYMLGVRRVSVTAAAMELQKTHLIRYQRGMIEVLDRRGLEAAACGCYASDVRGYAQFLS
jgi:CRP-like cAMP-binding protein